MKIARCLSTLLVLAVVCGCGHFVPYRPAEVQITEDPDAMYAAAIRVFVRMGWGLQSRDPTARVVETSYIETDDIDPEGRKVHVSYRVVVNRSSVEVFTSCQVGALSKPCPPDKRPKGTMEREQQLVQDMIRETKKL